MRVVVGMIHIVCFSGGHSSAIAAVEVVRRYGAENTVLLNHNLCPRTEDVDIKRFKNEVSDYLGVPITYANMPGWEEKDQFDVCEVFTDPGDVVIDPVAGSGTTLRAAYEMGRNSYGFEVDKQFYLAAKEKMLALTESE